MRANSIALEAHRSAEEAQLREQALAPRDPLTGLTNRRILSRHDFSVLQETEIERAASKQKSPKRR